MTDTPHATNPEKYRDLPEIITKVNAAEEKAREALAQYARLRAALIHDASTHLDLPGVRDAYRRTLLEELARLLNGTEYVLARANTPRPTLFGPGQTPVPSVRWPQGVAHYIQLLGTLNAG